MFAGKPGKGLQEIVSMEQRDPHAGQGLGCPGKTGVRGKEPTIEQDHITIGRQLRKHCLPLLGKHLAGEDCILDSYNFV